MIIYGTTEVLVDRVFPDGDQIQKAYRFLLGYVMYGCGAFVFHILDGILGSRQTEEQKNSMKAASLQKADLKIQKIRMDIFWTMSALSVAVPGYIISCMLIGLAHGAKQVEKARLAG